MWKNGQNEAKHSTWMLHAADWKGRSLMAARIVRGTISSVDEAERSRWRVYVYRKRTASKMSGTLALNHGGTGT